MKSPRVPVPVVPPVVLDELRACRGYEEEFNGALFKKILETHDIRLTLDQMVVLGVAILGRFQ